MLKPSFHTPMQAFGQDVPALICSGEPIDLQRYVLTESCLPESAQECTLRLVPAMKSARHRMRVSLQLGLKKRKQ